MARYTNPDQEHLPFVVDDGAEGFEIATARAPVAPAAYLGASHNLGAFSWPPQPEVDENVGTPAVTLPKVAPGVYAS